MLVDTPTLTLVGITTLTLIHAQASKTNHRTWAKSSKTESTQRPHKMDLGPIKKAIGVLRTFQRTFRRN